MVNSRRRSGKRKRLWHWPKNTTTRFRKPAAWSPWRRWPRRSAAGSRLWINSRKPWSCSSAPGYLPKLARPHENWGCCSKSAAITPRPPTISQWRSRQRRERGNAGARERGSLSTLASNPHLQAISSIIGPEEGCPELAKGPVRSEEHTSELQSRSDLVCRLLLEKKNRLLTALTV